MQVIAIIQARMGSARFPGKSMHKLSGKPSLEHLLDSVNQALPASDIYIATSTNDEDGVIADFAVEYGVNVFRGHSTNVASRFLEIATQCDCTHFIRLNGDSPLLDHRNISLAMQLSESDPNAIVSSTYERSLPSGMNIEIIPSQLFVENYPRFSTKEEFEHVTRFFYTHKNKFRITSFSEQVENSGNYHFSFDTEEDLKRIEKIFSQLKKPHYEYSLKDKCRIYDNL